MKFDFGTVFLHGACGPGPRESVLHGSSALSEFLSKVLTLSPCVKVKQHYHSLIENCLKMWVHFFLNHTLLYCTRTKKIVGFAACGYNVCCISIRSWARIFVIVKSEHVSFPFFLSKSKVVVDIEGGTVDWNPKKCNFGKLYYLPQNLKSKF